MKMPHITPELIAAIQMYCIAKAWTETVRPIVEGYQRKQLYIMQPINRYDGSIITDPNHSYSMSDEDFAIYLSCCNEDREKAGLKVPTSEYCPLLMAESAQTDAEHLILKNAEYFTHLTANDCLCHHPGVETMHKLTDLVIGLVFSYTKKHGIEMNILKKSAA